MRDAPDEALGEGKGGGKRKQRRRSEGRRGCQAQRSSRESQLAETTCSPRPAGWDNEKKIAILHENFTTVKPDDPYEDFIVKPPVRKLVHDKELAAEDEQVFLMKQQSFLAKQPATPTRASESPARGPTGSPRTQGRAGPTNVPSASPITSVKKPDPNIKNNAASEGVLASFFNSLLSKKTGSPGSPGAGGVQGTAKKSGQKTVLTNVQEELDRMTRKPDSVVTANSSTENEA